MDFGESWPVGLVGFPALQHEVEDFLLTGGWSRKVLLLGVVLVPVAAVLDDLLVGQFGVRSLVAVYEDLPEGDGEGPHVTLGRVLALQKIQERSSFVGNWLPKFGCDTYIYRM